MTGSNIQFLKDSLLPPLKQSEEGGYVLGLSFHQLNYLNIVNGF